MNKSKGASLFSYFNKPERAAYLFILPAVLILFLFIVLPLIGSVVFSFLKMDIFLKGFSFAGWDNYRHMFGDDRFWNAFKNTFYFAGVQMPLQIIISLLIAVYVSKNTLFRKVLRSTFFAPVVCSLTAVGIVWTLLLHPQIGLYPYGLTQLGFPKMGFFNNPDLAMPTVILLTIWKSFGYNMVILVAAIQSIPDSLYEASEIDGAAKTKQFFNITLPSIIPALGLCVVMTTIGALQVFDQIYVTTHGGPLNRTETIVTYLYKVGFQMSPYDLGYASAQSVLLFLMIVCIALVLNNYFLRKESAIA